MPSAVEIFPAWQIAGSQVVLVGAHISRQSARNGPEAPSVQCTKQCGMGHQARDAPIAIQEWVDPEQSVVRGCRSDDDFGLAKAVIGLLKLIK